MNQWPGAPYPPFYRPADPLQQYVKQREREIARRGLGIGLAVLGMTAFSFAFSFLMGFVLMQLDLYDFVRYQAEFSYLSPVVYYLQYAILYLGMVVPPFVVLALCFRMKSADYLPFERKTSAGVSLVCVAAGCGASILLNFMVSQFLNTTSLVGIVPDLSSLPYPEGEPVALALYGVVIAVLPAFAEEFAFRGVVLGLLRPYGQTFAVVASAFVFGIMHGNIVQIPFAFAGGLVFGFVVVRTGSLWPGILMHFLNNLLSYIQEILSRTLSDRAYLGYVYGLYLACALAVVLGVWWLLRRDGSFFRLQEDRGDPVSNKRKFSRFVGNPGMILAIVFVAFEVWLQVQFIPPWW